MIIFKAWGNGFFSLQILEKLQSSFTAYSQIFSSQKDMLSRAMITWENSRHFETPPLFFPPKDVWETSAEFHSDDMSLPGSWVVLLICWKFASTNHEHYPGAGSDVKNNFDTQLDYVDLRDSVKQARDTRQKKWIWNETTPTIFPFPLVK